MQKSIATFERWLGLALKVFAGSALVVLMVHVVVNALSRTSFNAPLEGTLEYVSNWYLPLIVVLGLVVAQQAKQHIHAELVFQKAPRQIQREFQLCAYGLSFVTALAVAWYSYVQAWENWDMGLRAGVSGVTIWPVTFAVPIGFVLFAAQLLVDAGRLIVARDSAHVDAS